LPEYHPIKIIALKLLPYQIIKRFMPMFGLNKMDLNYEEKNLTELNYYSWFPLYYIPYLPNLF
jgi:hypothetical protein